MPKGKPAKGLPKRTGSRKAQCAASAARCAKRKERNFARCNVRGGRRGSVK